MNSKIIIAPSEVEAGAIRGLGEETLRELGAEVVTGGVGMTETARTVLSILSRPRRPDMLILAGIAGAYGPTDGTVACVARPTGVRTLSVGDSVLVRSERTADTGAMRGDAFAPLFARTYTCPWLRAESPLRAVESNTVAVAGNPWVEPADIENMEGAAFFALCLEAGVPFLELRAVSNRVGAPREEWNIPRALEALARGMIQLLRHHRNL